MADEIVESSDTAAEDTGDSLDMANALDEISAGLGFAAEESETEEKSSEEGETSPKLEESSATPVGTPPPSDITAPKTWRPEAAAEWAKIPPTVQTEILKREEDIFRGLESYKELATHGKTFTSILEPYLPILRQAGLDPVQQVTNLMAAHYQLATGTPEQRQAIFRKLAQDYHITLGSADGDPPYEDPAVTALREKLSGVESTLAAQARREQETIRTALSTEITTFAADPAHQYFDEVASDVAALLRGGGAKDLADAYEKAVWSNPVTRAKEQTRLQTESALKAKKDAEDKAAAAHKASAANVKSRSRPASSTASLGSIDDTLNETLSAIRARA